MNAALERYCRRLHIESRVIIIYYYVYHLCKISTYKGFNANIIRPVSRSGQPTSGFLRPNKDEGMGLSLEQSIKTARTSHTARPVSAASGRFVRLGTV